ncbi:hypothetical protein AQUCO_00600254v1 [Aquilegia coerulea]|uniref:Uncharacterized protein n=1 Tax=Aquilegia coerulea TaxID=218851 RepID=A0A2G5ENV3_AQUCA|nr:hypothetical protein AQUCO_00600254v1 [Aquilegia coerulea]
MKTGGTCRTTCSYVCMGVVRRQGKSKKIIYNERQNGVACWSAEAQDKALHNCGTNWLLACLCKVPLAKSLAMINRLFVDFESKIKPHI